MKAVPRSSDPHESRMAHLSSSCLVVFTFLFAQRTGLIFVKTLQAAQSLRIRADSGTCGRRMWISPLYSREATCQESVPALSVSGARHAPSHSVVRGNPPSLVGSSGR